ncbi:MAG: hypothetical protein DRP66_12065 [Planctomycetota bacterium]|nr:MAG: hypothetical protein DRP66_12065 [Planctomycetota bacterium]
MYGRGFWDSIGYRFLKSVNIQDVLVFTVAVVFFAWEIYALSVGRATARSGLPDNYGNFEKNMRPIESGEQKDSFSFGVVGDPHSSGTFERLCEKLQNEPLSFIVITGDFSKRCRKRYHDFFIYQCANTYDLSVPVFLIPGNRDVDYDNTCGNDISMDQFRSMYGPENFCFEYSGCLFVGVCTFPDHVSSAGGIDYLENTLAARRKKGQKVFVFTHVPSVMKPGLKTGTFKERNRFIEIVNRYEVDYVFASHYHGYARSERDGTVYLVTGGGGAELAETESFGGLHHAMVLAVDGDSVSEKIILAQSRQKPSSRLARASLAYLNPVLAKHTAGSIAVNLLVFAVFCRSFGKCLLRANETKRSIAGR